MSSNPQRERTNGPPTAAISAPEPPGCKFLEIKVGAGRFMGRERVRERGHLRQTGDGQLKTLPPFSLTPPLSINMVPKMLNPSGTLQ